MNDLVRKVELLGISDTIDDLTEIFKEKLKIEQVFQERDVSKDLTDAELDLMARDIELNMILAETEERLKEVFREQGIKDPDAFYELLRETLIRSL